MGSYTRYGNPWVDLGPPDISASFLTALEDWIINTDQPTPVTVSGSSGTASLYQYRSGTIKRCILGWSNYKNTGGAQTLAIPVPFTVGAMIQTYETQGQTIEFLASGSAVTMSVQNSINAASGGTQLPQTVIYSWSSGQTRAAFDTVRLTFTSTLASGWAWFEGI